LRDAAERVLRSRPVLHREHADLVGGGHAAHRVRHVQPRALLAHDDRADVGFRRRFDDLVDRIADEELHAFALENLRDRCRRFHGNVLLRHGHPGFSTLVPSPRFARFAAPRRVPHPRPAVNGLA
jgi:hypothetical protein